MSFTGRHHAKMAELADALDSGSSARKGVEVQVLFFALLRLDNHVEGHRDFA